MAYDVGQHIRLGRVTAVAPSPDGTWLAVAVQRLDKDEKKFVSDLWRVPLQGEPVRLTQGDFDDRAPCFRWDGALGFLSRRPLTPGGRGDEGEDERAQVWVLPVTGEAFPLTDEPLGVGAFAFAREADVLVCAADVLPGVAHERQREAAAERKKKGPSALAYDRMPVRYWDHWIEPAAPHLVVYDAAGRRDLTPEADRELREMEWAVSDDGRRVVAIAAGDADDRLPQHAVRVYEVASGAMRELVAAPRTEYMAPCISPDGATVAVRAEVRHQRAVSTFELLAFDLESGQSRRLAPSWDREAFPQAWVGDGLIVKADDRGEVPLFEVRGDEVRRVSPPGGSHDGVSRMGEALVGVYHGHLQPPEPFVLEGGERRLAACLSGFTGSGKVRRERLTATSADGTEVDVLVVVPEGEGPFPALLWIHGGPIGAWADGWHWRWNPFVAASWGYVVALPNPRGSTGYGHDFTAGIWGNAWGAACYEDVLAATDALIEAPYVDAARVGVMGGSFGGYMANWIGANETTEEGRSRFRCIVTHASLYDISAFKSVTDWPEWLVHDFGLSPTEDLDAFERYSPHRFVSRWKTPTLVIHGEKDYRVPIGEGLALFEALQQLGVPSRLLVFPDENHWILKPRNVVAWYDEVEAFLGRYLRA